MALTRFPTIQGLNRPWDLARLDLIKGLDQWWAQLSADDRTFTANGTAVNALTANNALHLGGKVEGQLSVLFAASATSALALGGKSEGDLNVNSAIFANSATYLNGHSQTYYTNATSLATGTVPSARLGTGTANSTTFLAGDQSWKSITTLLVPDANTTVNGIVTTGTQSFAGVKTFTANATVGGTMTADTFRSLVGSSFVGSGVAATVLTLPSGTLATYIVRASLSGVTNDPTNYAAVSIVCVDGTAARITSLMTASLMSISLSGLNVQLTQSSGANQTVVGTALRMSS